MGKHNSFCPKCQEHNCHKHFTVETKTNRLQQLLEHFQEPEEEDMRVYIEPEKTKPNVAASNSESSPRRASIGHVFNENKSKPPSITTYVEPKPMPRSNTSGVTTNAMVIVNEQPNYITQPANTNSSDVLKLTGKNYKPHEKHHFVKINNSSFVSCSSPTGNYSELALVLWIDNKSFTRYMSSSERYRVVISLIYDAEDDLWCVSAKLLKRASSYSVKDEEEGHISNRLCIVNELRSEIKRMLLYLGISPREAYKLFRRNIEENTIITDSGAGFITVESAAHGQLLKDLEKTPSHPYTYYDHHGYGGYPHQGGGRYQSQVSNMREQMKDSDIRNRHLFQMCPEGGFID